MGEPYDWDAYASAFFPQAEALVSQAESAEKSGEKAKASELFLYVRVRSISGTPRFEYH